MSEKNRTHLLACVAALAKAGTRRDSENDRFALVVWGGWVPGQRPRTKLIKIEAPRRTNAKDTRIWGRVLMQSRWGKTVRTFSRETVLATFWECPLPAMLKPLKRALPRIPEEPMS